MTDGIAEHMKTVEKRLRRWLPTVPPSERINALADLRESIASLTSMERQMRRDALVELVEDNGVEAAAQSLDVTPERLLRVIGSAT